MINTRTLYKSLASVGLPVLGVDSDTVIYYSRNLAGEEKSVEQAILDAHDPTEYALSFDRDLIRANGIDVVLIHVFAKPNTVETIFINDEPLTLPIDGDGRGEIELVTDTPGVMIITGQGGLADFALEVVAA